MNMQKNIGVYVLIRFLIVAAHNNPFQCLFIERV